MGDVGSLPTSWLPAVPSAVELANCTRLSACRPPARRAASGCSRLAVRLLAAERRAPNDEQKTQSSDSLLCVLFYLPTPGVSQVQATKSPHTCATTNVTRSPITTGRDAVHHLALPDSQMV